MPKNIFRHSFLLSKGHYTAIRWCALVASLLRQQKAVLFEGNQIMSKEIELRGRNGKGKFIIVDDADYEWLNQYGWYLIRGSVQSNPRWLVAPDGSRLISRIIMNAPKGVIVDHKNRNKLDNRRENLRLATRTQNNQNRTPSKKTKSGYKGVVWHKESQLWSAKIIINKKIISLGYYPTKEEAAEQYNIAAQKYFGEFACKNIIKPTNDSHVFRSRKPRNSKLYCGVYLSASKKTWIAIYKHDGKTIRLGEFPTAELAARARDAAAIKHEGAKARLNFPELANSPLDIDKPFIAKALPKDPRSSSRYYGVFQNRNGHRWIAKITINGERIQKYFDSEIEAARAYDLLALQRGGKVIYLNFPDEV